MMLDNGGDSCKELEVRIDGKILTGLAGLYHLQPYISNGKIAYVHRHHSDKTLKYNSQTQYWEVLIYFLS